MKCNLTPFSTYPVRGLIHPQKGVYYSGLTVDAKYLPGMWLGQVTIISTHS